MNWFLFGTLFLTIFHYAFGFREYWYYFEDLLLGERCIDRWLPNDFTGLKKDLKQNIFGQPFIEEAFLPVLERHITTIGPRKKALVLSLHGSPGVGKTYLLEILAKHIFKAGRHSKFYKFFHLSDSFSLKQSELQELVINTVKKCPRAMFVFDEIEKMPDGIFESLKIFMDFHPEIDYVDYRKAVFVFISNIGMEKINDLSYSLWKQGVKRESFDLSQFEKSLFLPTYNHKGGLQKTGVVRNHLIDLYLPFLPLEKSHVLQCIKAEASVMGYRVSKEAEQKILKSLEFLPPNIEIYSFSGCKNIQTLIFRYGDLPNYEL